MNREDRKRLRELTIASHWTSKAKLGRGFLLHCHDWPGVYREMRQHVRDSEFYQETRGESDAYIQELRRLRDVALAASPLCEHCDQPAYMLARTGLQRCGAVHLSLKEARTVLVQQGL